MLICWKWWGLNTPKLAESRNTHEVVRAIPGIYTARCGRDRKPGKSAEPAVYLRFSCDMPAICMRIGRFVYGMYTPTKVFPRFGCAGNKFNPVFDRFSCCSSARCLRYGYGVIADSAFSLRPFLDLENFSGSSSTILWQLRRFSTVCVRYTPKKTVKIRFLYGGAVWCSFNIT